MCIEIFLLYLALQVSWLATCAIELGPSAVLRILQSWNRLFTPTEATSIVATTILNSPSTTSLTGYKHQGCLDCCTIPPSNYYYNQSNPHAVDLTKQENIIASVRALALQCAHEVSIHYLFLNILLPDKITQLLVSHLKQYCILLSGSLKLCLKCINVVRE